MPSRLIDITAALTSALPVWPDSPGWDIEVRRDVANGDPVTESTLNMDVHCGTHVDAPLHHLAGAGSVDELDLEAFIGTALVHSVDGTKVVTADHLRNVPIETERLLLRTDNSRDSLLRNSRFRTDFVALSLDAARFVAGLPNLKLLGVDYLSVQVFGGDDETHRVLMSKNIAIVEGLDLYDAPDGRAELIALPLALTGAEAAPVRAVLRIEEPGS